MLNVSDLQILILDCVRDQLDSPEIRRLFMDTIAIKVQAFSKYYARPVVAAGKDDFFCTHVIIARKSSGGPIPLLAYKSIDLERCLEHKIAFPAIAHASEARAAGIQREAELAVERCSRQGLKLRYCYGYGIGTNLQDREDRKFLQHVMAGIHANFHQTWRTRESWLAGAPKVKSDQMFVSWGYEPIYSAGEDVSRFNQVSLDGEDARMFRLRDNAFSDYAQDAARRFGFIWAQRIELLPPAAAPAAKAA